MDILLYILLSLSVPVFYVIGLLTVISRYLHRGSSSVQASFNDPTTPVDPAVIADLRHIAAKQSPEIARQLNQIVGRLEAVAPAPVVVVPVPVPVPAPAASWSSLELSGVTQSLDNINVLLYLGAFLVVVSAGIFVGYNFQSLTGVFKTVFLGGFAAIFYIVGLMLFLRTTKLRPAGVTFTGIGLVLLPLIGLAAYNFTSLHDYGSATWFMTSLLTLTAYVVTLAVTRQTYIAYLMAFTTLSTFESSISLFNLPVYYFGWAMATVSILLLLLSSTKLLWKETNEALFISANIFVPISLVLSLFAVGDHGLSQIGVTIGLAGVFYAAMAQRFAHKPAGDMYWGLALFSLPAALGVGLWDSLTRVQIGLVMLAVCALYFICEHLLASRLSQPWRQILAFAAGLLPLAGILVEYDHPGTIVAMLAVAALVNGELALRQRQSGLGLLAILSLLTLPLVFGRLWLNPVLPWSTVTAVLLLEVPLLVLWARRMADWPESGKAVGQSGYLLAMILALSAAAFSSETALLVTGLVVAAALYGLSITERSPEYVYGAVASLYLALGQISGINHWDLASTSLILALAGAGVYALSLADANPARSLSLRYCGMIGPFIGAFLGIVEETRHIEPAMALAIGGGLLFAEGRRQAQPLIEELAGGVLILAFNWMLYANEATQLQFYTLPWAAYAAYLGFRRRAGGHAAYDGFAGLSLAILTIPLATQALADNGQGYSLLLIVEAIGLVFLGMALSFRLVTVWGVATLVAEVLYQMRDFFYALPKYLISAGLGLALLAIAIVMLQRRKSDD